MLGQHHRGWNDKKVDKGEIRCKPKGGGRKMEDYEEAGGRGKKRGGEGERR